MDKDNGIKLDRTPRKVKRVLLNMALVVFVVVLLLFTSPAKAGAETDYAQEPEPLAAVQQGKAASDEEQIYLYAIPKTADYALPTLAIVAAVSTGGLLWLAYRSRRGR